MTAIFNIISRFSFAMAFLLTCAIANAASDPDTLLKVTVPSRVVVTENPQGTDISVYGTDNEKIATVATAYEKGATVRANSHEGGLDWLSERKLIPGKKKSNYWNISLDGVCIGLTDAINQSPAGGLQWSKSFEICWMSCINVYYKFGCSKISFGLGFDFRNYKITTSDKCLVPYGHKGIAWGNYPEGARGRNSRLKVTSLQFPLLYQWSVPKSSLQVKVGPIFNFNTYASLKTTWDDSDGNRHEFFTKDLEPARFTVDFYLGLSLCNAIGIYGRYSPCKVITTPGGLSFTPLTVGITLAI